MVPKIEKISDFAVESFEEYFKRWPEQLGNIPKDVVQQWAYYHNEEFLENWAPLDPVKWDFTAVEFTNDKIMEIDHLDGKIERMDSKGDEVFRRREPGYDTWDFMFEYGTTPCPMIVVRDADGVVPPGGINQEVMKTPLQIVEGHRRLTLIRAFIRHGYRKLQSTHRVWILNLNM